MITCQCVLWWISVRKRGSFETRQHSPFDSPRAPVIGKWASLLICVRVLACWAWGLVDLGKSAGPVKAPGGAEKNGFKTGAGEILKNTQKAG